MYKVVLYDSIKYNRLLPNIMYGADVLEDRVTEGALPSVQCVVNTLNLSYLNIISLSLLYLRTITDCSEDNVSQYFVLLI